MKLKNLYRLHDFLHAARKRVKNVSMSVSEDVVKKDILLISSSLVYFTLISIVPFLIFITPILRSYGVLGNITSALYSGLSSVLGSEATSTLKLAVSDYVGNGLALGIISILTFGYSSVALVNRVKNSIDKLYKVPAAEKNKNIFFSFAKSFVYIIVFAFLLVLISVVYSYIYTSHSRFSIVFTSKFSRRIAIDLFVLLLFFLISTSMPNVYVNPKCSFAGSCVFLLLFRIINLVIVLIIKYFFRNKFTIYGSFALVIGVLLWIYMFWSIIMISVDVSYVSQYKPNAYTNKKKTPNQYLQDGINVMYFIVDGFNKGEGGATLEKLSRRLAISSKQVVSICEKLENSKLISSSGSLKKRRYFPYCKTSDLKLYYIIKALEGDYYHNMPNSAILAELQNIKIANFSDKTFENYKRGSNN